MDDLFSLFCSTWRAVLKMFVILFRIDQVKASKNVQQPRSNLQKRKLEKRRQKEFKTEFYVIMKGSQLNSTQ